MIDELVELKPYFVNSDTELFNRQVLIAKAYYKSVKSDVGIPDNLDGMVDIYIENQMHNMAKHHEEKDIYKPEYKINAYVKDDSLHVVLQDNSPILNYDQKEISSRRNMSEFIRLMNKISSEQDIGKEINKIHKLRGKAGYEQDGTVQKYYIIVPLNS